MSFYKYVFSQSDYKHYLSYGDKVINRRHFEFWWSLSHILYFLSKKGEIYYFKDQTMPKLLQINVTANSGSHGKIAEGIGKLAMDSGWDSWIAYGRGNSQSASNLIRIGNDLEIKLHGIETRIFDNHGLASKRVTRRFIEQVKEISPDIIHLHNIHGYYLNYPILFEYLREWGGPVVWTLHDCWSFTGHCSHFMLTGCDKWKTRCNSCGNLKAYPKSLLFDNSSKNFDIKKNSFLSLGEKLVLVPVSYFVGNYLKDSFFCNTKMKVIHNGIDLNVFSPSSEKEKMILGVSNVWTPLKGLNDFFKLRRMLPHGYKIVMVGLTDKQIRNLPDDIIGIKRTEGQKELARLYSTAMVFVNPTYEDNYPTVNLESIACGTPVITYRTGGSPESITHNTGIIVEKGDVDGLLTAIKAIETGNHTPQNCRDYAEAHFDQRICFQEYIKLYNQLL